ncbi:MAG TPA: ROK family transcriptional regulator, partial [Vicinamibacteria bacterium]|nr:ROK family transcriptional regulator [Vicinamibacteria bacterium]
MRRISPTAFRIAKRGTLREINRQIALNLIRSKQPVSRAELARLMGLRRGAVSLLVNELLRKGLIFEGAKGESKRGRKPRHLYIETRRACALAVDVSASRTSILVTDVLGHPLLDVSEFPTRRRPQTMVRELVRNIERILAGHPEVGACVGVGVVVSGMVGLDDSRLKYSPTLGWRDVNLLEPLKAATGLPVVVENSVKACVLAQVWAVRGDAPVDGPVAFLNVSDGVGVGIAIDGKLLRGAHNIAGEFGHVPLHMYGPGCSCGQKGCWEAYVSKRATIARYLGTDPSWPASARPAGVTIEDVIARAQAGEGRALETLRETGYYLGRGLATIVKSIDPRRVYIGGEITAAWDLIESTVREALREQAPIPEAGDMELLTVPLGEHPR